MNGKKARKLRSKAVKLSGYMKELYEIELREWKAAEPRKIRFISHFIWKKRKPIEPTDAAKAYKKYFNR